MATALYRKYRSRSLDEIVGQQHITALLRRAIDTDTTGHAYLLTGPRGVGKTSIARILAHEINKLEYSDDQHLDIIEIDAASNNGVDDIRELREKAHIVPTHAPKKIYIIDEVHMLSKPAFNALLKTLEEPPAHIVFIMATTDYDKLPATIISRSQRFHFRSISVEDIVRHLRTIADTEHIAISDAALRRIAEHSEGTFRDSISLLDQLQNVCARDETIDVAHIDMMLGTSPQEKIDELIALHRENDLTKLSSALFVLEHAGVQASTITHQLIRSVMSTIHTHPEDVTLLEALTRTHNAPYPYIALLGCLYTTRQTAQIVSSPAKPTQKKVTPTPAAKPAAKVATVASQPIEQPCEESDPAPTPMKQPTSTVPADPSQFDWNTFVAEVKNHTVGGASILSKSGYELDGDTLVIFAGRAFNAKKLLDAKNLPALHTALEVLGCGAMDIRIEATPAPPKDADAAALAALMGGGEEVTL